MATKRLARQLGLIRRKSFALANGNLGRSRSKQLYDYLIVIDFESTCWNDGKHHSSPEIIEFPAVLLNASTGEIESEFHAYVQPQEHPTLSEFCMELTGIKQAQIDEGVPLKICLSQFCKWIHRIQQQKKIIFAAEASEPTTSEVKLCAFVTWSDWDLGVCLEYECRRKQLLKPVFLSSWIDLRATYKLFYKRKPKGLSGALQEVGIEFSGREHSGLDDSRNTALLAWKMIRDGCLMKITKSFSKVPIKKNPNTLTRNLSTNQVEATSACNSSIQSPSIYQKESKEISCAHDCLPMLTDWEDGVLLPVSQDEQDTDCMPPVSDTNLDNSFNSEGRLVVLKDSEMPSNENFGGLETPLSDTNLANSFNSEERPVVLKNLEMQSHENFGGLETPQKIETSKSIMYKSPHTTIYNVKEAKHPSLDVSTFKLPECKLFTFDSVNARALHPSDFRKQPPLLCGAKRNSPSLPASPPAKKQTFTIHEEKPTSSDCSPASSSRKVLPSVLTSAVNLQEPWKWGKLTPPLCKCGRRSKRLTVSNNGPNHGKAFYCCPVGKYEENRKCCGYFKWEQTLQKERANSTALSHCTGGLTFSSPETSHINGRNLSFSTKNFLRLRPSMRN
ncbi:ERI1 exoribonuclease 2 isoform X6 [Nannospalax galili]|uniref:ERI1 exoribonuclease 2 isoform X6 n=1 Tax=Nannospalax galili TaxID=1026970 RepID=UPI00111C757B|nr:ERI1 exoribonuclease 2 isoform X6 [Nannospalax galili]